MINKKLIDCWPFQEILKELEITEDEFNNLR
ncbi:hypothetical protein NIES806_46610 [Dolichospermum compactum NIES-806]|uniref:Uncharacterized protein n=1 Tax=Dolichospermum compactum NIES-806 TaxID=1973481 RepID=A0A1Z4VAK4_9CYAN|nr:hypothetical protein NIES806_46610 [Dolichospermum compactum NIES-806]